MYNLNVARKVRMGRIWMIKVLKPTKLLCQMRLRSHTQTLLNQTTKIPIPHISACGSMPPSHGARRRPRRRIGPGPTAVLALLPAPAAESSYSDTFLTCGDFPGIRMNVWSRAKLVYFSSTVWLAVALTTCSVI